MVDSFNNKKVLITGGLGFIGSNLAIRLVDLGAEVTIIDSLIPQYGGNLFNIEPISGRVKINYSDIRNEYSNDLLIKDKDYIFNLAGQSSHMDSLREPFTDLEINTTSQLKLLESCKRTNPTVKIIYASTRQIYGRANYLPVDERHPIAPIDVNGINKYAGEQYHMLYDQLYDMSCVSLRLTNTYGPRMRVKDERQTFLGVWISNFLTQEKIAVWGGEQLRDYNYIDDVVEAMLLCAAREVCRGKVYNLGNDEVLSLKQTAECFSEGEPSHYKVTPFPKGRKKIDIGDYYADYGRFMEDTGWEPKVRFSEGIGKTLAYYKEHLNKYL
ncbi:MAG: NAD-dependent epimerase/dehydratase family protein [Reichenbachiella sp.]